MLVLVTNREDLTADWLVLELQRREQPFVRLCTEDYPSTIGIELTDLGGRLELGSRSLTADEVDSVWWRRSLAPVVPDDRDRAQMEWAAGEAHVAWNGFWRSVSAHWVNRPEANAYADCKPLQLREARKHGLLVPPTVITNITAVARAFQARYGAIICKPLYSGVVPDVDGERLLYTQRIEVDAFDRAGEIGPEPYLLQEFVDKTADVRVTVMGDRVFACRIDSQLSPESAVDWRRGSSHQLPHEPIELDDETSRKLQALTSHFDLRFAAIDLAVDHQGRYVFLEINPNGQWAWIEQLTGQPLRAALADELLNPT